MVLTKNRVLKKWALFIVFGVLMRIREGKSAQKYFDWEGRGTSAKRLTHTPLVLSIRLSTYIVRESVANHTLARGSFGRFNAFGAFKKKKKKRTNEQNMAKNKINKTTQKNSGAGPRGEPCECLRPTQDDTESTSAGAFVHPLPGWQLYYAITTIYDIKYSPCICIYIYIL